VGDIETAAMQLVTVPHPCATQGHTWYWRLDRNRPRQENIERAAQNDEGAPTPNAPYRRASVRPRRPP